MTVASIRRPHVLVLLGVAALAVGMPGCTNEAPSPWKEMRFPLRKGEIRPGADENRLLVVYRGAGRQADFFREFKSALERAGYTEDGESTRHDPPGNAFSVYYKKGTDRILLTVKGRKDTDVELKRNLD
jgi:hypothetical protein